MQKVESKTTKEAKVLEFDPDLPSVGGLVQITEPHPPLVFYTLVP